ncbi:MAG TPA: nitroreductase family protein [Acidimicrobiales bacterium]|nr:nitroreductase family protein [Acidimicrobiales bacterium]
MDIDQLLTSTRSARKTLDLEAPVDLDVVAECLRIALHAANGTNQQSWRWLVVADAGKRREIASQYAASYESMTGGRIAASLDTDSDFGRLMASTEWLVDHLADVPVHVIPCYQPYIPRNETNEQFATATLYGSVFPAVWNFQLALRSRGYGSCITTLHLNRAAEVGELLGIPETYFQGCLLPVARLRTVSLRPTPRKSLDDVTAVDGWHGPALQGSTDG